MLALFGVASHSLPKVLTTIKRHYSVFVVANQYLDHKSLLKASGKAQVLMFGTWKDFTTNMFALQKYPGVAIVFETPIRLAEIDNITLLDSKQEHSWKFRFAPVNWKLFKVTTRRALNEKAHIKLKISKINHLAAVIEKYQQGRFLDKLNSLIYSITNHTNRDEFRRRILNWLCSDDPPDAFESPTAFRGEAAKLLNEFLNFIDSDGKTFRKALKEAAETKDKGKAPNFVKLAKAHSVDAYELRYILKNHTKSRKEGRQTNVAVASIAAEYAAKAKSAAADSDEDDDE